MNIKTTDWMLHIARRCKWLRHLPGWHRREADFRDWYVSLLDRIDLTTDAAYEQALKVLKCPEQVSGYREVRYPKMDTVRQQIESELSSSNKPQSDVEMKPPIAGRLSAISTA